MKQRFTHFSFVIPLVIFVSHQLLKHLVGIDVTFIDNYIDPFCMSALALHVLATERLLFFDSKLGVIDIVIATIFLSVVSEILFPYFSNRFTSDMLDVVAIIAGSFWYILTQPKKGYS